MAVKIVIRHFISLYKITLGLWHIIVNGFSRQIKLKPRSSNPIKVCYYICQPANYLTRCSEIVQLHTKLSRVRGSFNGSTASKVAKRVVETIVSGKIRVSN